MKARLLFAIGVCFVFVRLVAALETPPLSITNSSGGFVVSWPASATDWRLEESSHLGAPIPWAAVAPELYRSNTISRYVTFPGADGNRFFRLRQGALAPGVNVPGLTGSWQLEEGAGQNSASRGGAGATLFFSNAVWSSGRFGAGGLRFNGLGTGAGGSRAWVSNSNYRVLPAPGQPFSASLWFNLEVLTLGWRGLMGNDANGSNGWHVALHTPGPGTNNLVFAGTGSSLSVTGRTLLLPNQWHQLTITYDGATGSIYLDGTLLAQEAGPLPTHSGPIYFGGGVANWDSFLGRLDDLRAYTNCLSHEEISLNGHWAFDEGLGSLAADSSIQGRHGTIPGTGVWVAGRSGSGLALNLGPLSVVIPNKDYAVLPASGGTFSLSFWLRPNSIAPGRSGLMSCDDGTNGGWQLLVDAELSGKSWLCFESTNCGGTLDLRAPVPLTNGVWTKLDITFNGGIATAYANGRKTGSRSGAIRGSRSPLTLGAVAGFANLNGVMDDLKIYSRERGETEIGPIARTMWETALLNSTTNIPLQGFGPPGKPLTYTLRPIITPTNGTVALSPGSSSVTFSAGLRKGPDAFVYEVSDGEFTSEPAIVAMSVVEPHWLSPNGGSTGPLDGKNPAHAWAAASADAVDAIWRTNNYYDCFFYAPGIYETRGWKHDQRFTANPGCKHVGSGSSGPNETRLRLVDILDARNEERFFCAYEYSYCDDFEVHQMVLDCNAPNLPKFIRGEPVWIRIPLLATARIDSVTLLWNESRGFWSFGHAAEIDLCARNSVANTTNCTSFVGVGETDVLNVGVEADELVLQFNRRGAGIDFYSLAEVQVSGGAVSLPSATVAGQSERSELAAGYAITSAVDGDFSTSWASGPEDEVQITLPLKSGTRLSQVNLHWNCKTTVGTGRLGPATSFSLQARDEITGLLHDLAFVRHGRGAAGLETVTLGTLDSTNAVITDQLVLRLTGREPSVDHYSLREVTLQDGPSPVVIPVPIAQGNLNSSFNVLRAFDGNLDTAWACDTQGAVSAIDVQGNNLKFTGLKIVGFGTKGGRECFPLAFLAFSSYLGPMHLGNVLIEDCTFSDPVGTNGDGLSTVHVAASPPNTLTNAVVRRCTVSGVKSHFLYSHAFLAPTVENCLINDCQIGVYSEPEASTVDNIGPILVRSNRFVNVDSGVYLLSHPAAQFDSLTCLNNEIVLNTGGTGISFCDACDPGPSASTTNVVFLNNVIRYPDWGLSPTIPGTGVYYADIHHGVVGNNLVAFGAQNTLRIRNCPAGIIPALEDCDHPGPLPPTYPFCLDSLPPGYRRAWFNNRNFAGDLLSVQFYNQGVLMNASQQQWPE